MLICASQPCTSCLHAHLCFSGVYLMLNLFIAVIIDNFSNVYNKETNLITSEHLEELGSELGLG